MNKTRAVTAIAVSLIISASAASAKNGLKKSVIKIYTVSNSYDYDSPWQMRGQTKGTGSGCIINGRRILTNAHVVSNHTFIQVKRAGEAKKYIAKLEAISHESDLAILKVDDPDFFKDAAAIAIGKLPEVRDKVAVYGFPTGGDELSITEGVVSRIEQRHYAHNNANLLTCQIDAAINPGNSGGPVIKDKKIIGVAFQAAARGQNIGYMVPAPIIKHFLTDIKDGRYDGFPELGIFYQKMENPDLRAKYNMSEEKTGVRIAGILIDSPVRNIIKKDDIVLSIDGVNIDNDGSIEFRDGERTSLDYIVQKKYINDWISCRILRDRKIKTVRIKLTVPINSTRLVPFDRYDVPPTYFIRGGLVFEPLSKNYLEAWGRQWFFSAPSKLLNYYINGIRSEQKKEVVLLVKVLADEINLGYHDMENLVISRINGKNIAEMKDVVKAFDSVKGDYHIIIDDMNRKIIIKKENLNKYSSKILKRYRIRSDRSPDLKD